MAVVTISRETGGAGEFIAAEVARRLGVPLADREIIEEAARNAGLPQEVLDSKEQETRTERTFSSSDMVGLIRRSQSGKRQQLADALYTKFVSEAVRQIASKPCVIVGRGAQFILQDRSDALHVHLYAPESVRVSMTMREKGITREQAERLVRAGDLERSNYIKHYFNNANWRNPDYYHLMIDTGRITPEVAVDLIIRAVESISPEAFSPVSS
ncbi:MAG: cytidylate kinase-like family protein [Anaerolineae bacterium]